MKSKKKQHYIWKYYLSPWSTDGKIWSYRDGKIFFSSRDNIGQQRFFYEIKPLNDFERKLLEGLIKSKHQPNQLVNNSIFEIYYVVSNGNEFTRRNGIEEYHTGIEHKAIPILEMLLNEDLSWLKNNASKINFANFLGVQYCRTKRSHDALLTSIRLVETEFPKYRGMFDPEKISKAYVLFLGAAIGNLIYSSGNISFLKNSTAQEFLTGDQPVYNLSMKGQNEEVTEFNFFYPISPQLALLITSTPRCDKELSIDEVNKYNQFIVSVSHEQLYAKNKESLTTYKSEV